MKFLVLDKYSIITAALAAALVCAVPFNAGRERAVSTAAKKDIPIYSVETDEKAVSITFDCAWGNEDVDEVLEALRNANCKASFFMTGEWIDKFPEDAKKISADGHEIANHSDRHLHFNALSAEEMAKDIDACDEKIRAVTGQQAILFRAPYGEYNSTLVQLCKGTERLIVQWSLDSLDYKGLDADKMGKRILPKLQNGDIILFHLGTKTTAAALPKLLSDISAKGYSYKKTGDLVYKENYETDHTGRQIKTVFHTLDGGSCEAQVKCLRGYGWEVNETPVEIVNIVIPESMDEVYGEYNKIQQRAGLDITPYCGKSVTKYTYEVKNHAKGDTHQVYANLLICENRIIAGDIMTRNINGFMHALNEGEKKNAP